MSQAQRPPPPGSMVLKSNPSIILLCSFLPSDYIIEEKTAVLQKREHEGFGFVLRGAKGKGCFFHLVLGLGESSVSSPQLVLRTLLPWLHGAALEPLCIRVS